jgi:hypothetical protein
MDASSSSDAGAVEASVARRVFVTSETFRSDLGGLVGADAQCQRLADAAGLAGTFRAWLSDATVSVALRLTHGSTAYELVDGKRVANDWNDLTDGTLQHAIDLDERGLRMVGDSGTGCPECHTVFTSTGAAGQYAGAGDDCTSWLMVGGFFTAGDTRRGDSGWTLSVTGQSCAERAHLYCFEQ